MFSLAARGLAFSLKIFLPGPSVNFSCAGFWRCASGLRLAFVTPRLGAREPYINLYMYLLMQTISRWLSVKAILPSAAELNKGRAHAATQCKLLLGCQYVHAFSPEDGISTMTLLDPKLYHDEDWITAQVSQFHTILIYSYQISMKILNKV